MYKYYLKICSLGNILNNCLASYEHIIESHLTTVHGFFIEIKLIFAAEIKDKTIIQAYRKYNTPLNSLENGALVKWMKESNKVIKEF